MKKRYIPTIGTVSHGTMRNEDLIPCFLDEINRISKKRITQLRKDKEWKRILYFLKRYGHLPSVLFSDDNVPISTIMADTDWGDYTAELFDILNELAPPYCSFGSSEGDGSDYGFWPSIDFHCLESDFDGPVIGPKDNEETISEKLKGYRGYWMEISDHGNASLMQRNAKGKDKHIWGVV